MLGLLDDLASAEREHERRAEELEQEKLGTNTKKEEDEASRRLFVLQIVQPGLAGLMDGSVSTLAPVFAAALTTHTSRDAFVVGLAASVGAGISMGFAEALSDDGSLTGRGRPWMRGFVCGIMTACGGIGHTLPFLIPEFHTAIVAAVIVVLVELAAIAWIRNRYMDTPPLSAALQVGLGGAPRLHNWCSDWKRMKSTVLCQGRTLLTFFRHAVPLVFLARLRLHPPLFGPPRFVHLAFTADAQCIGLHILRDHRTRCDI